jgi:hypothetical protein
VAQRHDSPPRPAAARTGGLPRVRLPAPGPDGRSEPGAFPPPPEPDPLGAYLSRRATEFLRSLRDQRENAGSARTAPAADEAVLRLRRAARRIGGTLHTYRGLVDAAWADQLRTELHWLSGTLSREYACAARLDTLLAALQRLAGSTDAAGDALPAGAARAGALLERQLTLARTRAHSAALRALGSSRFHAVADEVAVLASPAPAGPPGPAYPPDRLAAPARAAQRRLAEAVEALPPARAEHPYGAVAEAREDAAWHHVRTLLRLHRYAREVLYGEDDARLAAAVHALDRHRDAAEAAAAAASAARTPRIAPATAYALGVLHADQRHEVGAARSAFAHAWPPPSG